MTWIEKLLRQAGFVRLSRTYGPKDFKGHRGWDGRGVLAEFDGIHGLEILVTDQTEKANEENFRKTWETDADEIIFRRDKKISLYWRERTGAFR